MTIQEIKAKICDLRCSVDELQDEAYDLWKETNDEYTEKEAIYISDKLEDIANELASIED